MPHSRLKLQYWDEKRMIFLLLKRHRSAILSKTIPQSGNRIRNRSKTSKILGQVCQ